jgi:hypothetical protein
MYVHSFKFTYNSNTAQRWKRLTSIFCSLNSNATGNYSVTYINQTKKINVGGILIEYEGEDSGIGLLFASKAAIQVL